GVGGKTQAAGTAESIARKRLQAVECGPSALPEFACLVGTVGLARHVVPRRPAAKGKAAVSPARALRDPARIVDADSQTSACERERAGGTRDTGTDDRDIRRAVERSRRSRRQHLIQPERPIHPADATSGSRDLSAYPGAAARRLRLESDNRGVGAEGETG